MSRMRLKNACTVLLLFDNLCKFCFFVKGFKSSPGHILDNCFSLLCVYYYDVKKSFRKAKLFFGQSALWTESPLDRVSFGQSPLEKEKEKEIVVGIT